MRKAGRKAWEQTIGFVFDERTADLLGAAPDLLAALKGIVATYRTFRNVPKDRQEWTPLDDEALAAGYDAIDKAEGRN